MWTTTLILAMAAATGPSGPSVATPPLDRPRLAVWTNRDDVYRSGDKVRVFVEVEQDAYVTVMHVDTDGRIRVLFPLQPYDDGFLYGRSTYEISGQAPAHAFYADHDPGMGYVFAVASYQPFDYSSVVRAGDWHYRAMYGGQISGDPYVALTGLADRIVRVSDDYWDYDITPYYVESQYAYPRFLCYDCHTYRPYGAWDPYRFSCVKFRVVVYDDPYYYPYRRYGGTRVVFTRPAKPAPRYVFKTWGDDRQFVTKTRREVAKPNKRTGRPVTSTSAPRERVSAQVESRRRDNRSSQQAQPSRSARRQQATGRSGTKAATADRAAAQGERRQAARSKSSTSGNRSATRSAPSQARPERSARPAPQKPRSSAGARQAPTAARSRSVGRVRSSARASKTGPNRATSRRAAPSPQPTKSTKPVLKRRKP